MSEIQQLTQEISNSLSKINKIHLQSAIHLVSGQMTCLSDDLISICRDLVLRKGIARFLQFLPEKYCRSCLPLQQQQQHSAKNSAHRRTLRSTDDTESSEESDDYESDDDDSDRRGRIGRGGWGSRGRKRKRARGDGDDKTAKEILEDFVNEVGIVKFLTEHVSFELLRQFSFLMGLTSLEERPNAMDLADEIMLCGMEEWLQHFPRLLLCSWCTDLGIKFSRDPKEKENLSDKIMSEIFSLKPLNPEPGDNITTNINPTVTATTTSTSTSTPTSTSNTSPTTSSTVTTSTATSTAATNTVKPHQNNLKRKNEQDDTQPVKKKVTRGKHKCPPLSNIKKGVTKEELHNLYNVTDLQQWCKQNNTNHLGKKSILIKRILDFLETGKPTPTKKKGKGKKKN